jgi:hypothetical protein
MTSILPRYTQHHRIVNTPNATGIHTFHVALESCDGNWALVEEAMKGANTEVDPVSARVGC